MSPPPKILQQNILNAVKMCTSKKVQKHRCIQSVLMCTKADLTTGPENKAVDSFLH